MTLPSRRESLDTGFTFESWVRDRDEKRRDELDRFFGLLSLDWMPIRSKPKDGTITWEMIRGVFSRAPQNLQPVVQWFVLGVGTINTANQFASGLVIPHNRDRAAQLYESLLDEAGVSPEESEGLLALFRGIRPGVPFSIDGPLSRVEKRLRYIADSQDRMSPLQIPDEPAVATPPEIQRSLAAFRKSHPDPRKVGFIMMRFGKSKPHATITAAINNALAEQGLIGLRADDRQFHDDLLANILTYIHGCGFGIAVFERIEADEFNPNVALEVGYMMALGKPVCLLKDQTLKTLQVDLIGKIYKDFDSHDIEATIRPGLRQWLVDKNLAGTQGAV